MCFVSRIEELEHVIESTKSSSKVSLEYSFCSTLHVACQASLATQSEETQRQKVFEIEFFVS